MLLWLGKQKSLPFIAMLILISLAPTLAQTPVNDDFANREVLTGTSITFGGSFAGATTETGEVRSPFYWSFGASGSV